MINWNARKTAGSVFVNNQEVEFTVCKLSGRISSDLRMGDKIILQHADKEYLIEQAEEMAEYLVVNANAS